MKHQKGILFVISGPSGCGKTTLCRKLLKRKPGLVRSVSLTTRPPRKQERQNRDYTYITKEEFEKEIEKKSLLEYAEIFGSYYGTPKKPVSAALKKGKDVILSIDIQGAAQIHKAFKKAVLIFILPPAFDDLKKRLIKRSSDSTGQIRKRLRTARREIKTAGTYDYVVINDDMKKATDSLIAIVAVERLKAKRRKTP